MKVFTLPTIFEAIDKFSGPVDKMNARLDKFSKSAMNTSRSFAIAGALILAPLVLMANSAVKFEDKMADVAKTSGLAGKELQGLGEDILKMSGGTRTSIEGLQEIAEIGGQLGIQGRENILAFTDSVNKFNVALGSDFQGGVKEAARAIGGLNGLFKETRDLDIATSITKTGSAINALSAKGVQVPEVTEFIKRVGQLPDAIKPSIQETAALGAVFNKTGITAEIASRAVGDVLLTATQNLPKFAKQMGVSTEALKNMLDNNPLEFLKKFSAGLKGMPASEFGKVAQSLKLGDSGSVKILGSLSTSLEKLNEFQKISNDEFAKGTSLLVEYTTKNETMAGKILRSKNNFEALSIMIGTELLPIIGDLITELTPVIRSFIEWTNNNKPLVATLSKTALGISAVMFAISGMSAILAGVGAVIKIFRIAQLLWIGVMHLATAAQWAWNAAMAANPIGLMIIAIGLLIIGVALIIKYWDQWGASLTLFLGPLGQIISLVMSFVNNWEMITKAFKEGGILGAIKAIGATLLDYVLTPLHQILETIARITGADWANNAAKGLQDFRGNMGLDVSEQKSSAVSTSAAEEAQSEQEAYLRNSINKQNTTLTIDNKTGNKISTHSDNNLIDIKMGSTMKYGLQ